ncbi:MAG: serine/threonine-protein kinase [Flavobacteriaceae bacterium]|nr:serine/threonine-protein kinase [Flavobacteriaceae bacterium]
MFGNLSLGTYIFNQRTLKFHSKKNMSLGKVIGSGAYGIVSEIKINGKMYAVKRNTVSVYSDGISCIREYDMLLRIGDHPNINKMVYHTTSKISDEGLGEELREGNIHFIFDKCQYDILEDDSLIDNEDEIRKVIKSMLSALKYLHDNGIVHRDIKPSNILKSYTGEYELCDFGMSLYLTKQTEMSNSVTTILYRAPEMFLSQKRYSFNSDIWSVGCLMYELLTGERLIKRIPNGVKDFAQVVCKIIPNAFNYLKGFVDIEMYDSETFECKLNNYDKETVDLLTKMLEVDPSKRIDVSEALNHKYFDEKDELIDIAFCSNKIEQNIEISHKYVGISKTIKLMVKNKTYKPHSNIRSVFHCLDIYQRYMHWRKLNGKSLKGVSLLCLYTCMYISFKYFSPIEFQYTISDIFIVPKTMCENDIIDIESEIVTKALTGKLYNKTPLECVNDVKSHEDTILTEDEQILLFNLFVDNVGEMSSMEIAEKFLDVL